jgi:hypothetical protein
MTFAAAGRVVELSLPTRSKRKPLPKGSAPSVLLIKRDVFDIRKPTFCRPDFSGVVLECFTRVPGNLNLASPVRF